ncbi:hypothetical protein ACETU7_06090 [Rhodococcus sp. 3Y1]
MIAEPAVAAPRIHPVPIPGEGLFTDLHAFFDIGFDVSEEFPLHVRLLEPDRSSMYSRSLFTTSPQTASRWHHWHAT